jgi:hypothetical protein
VAKQVWELVAVEEEEAAEVEVLEVLEDEY